MTELNHEAVLLTAIVNQRVQKRRIIEDLLALMPNRCQSCGLLEAEKAGRSVGLPT
jgi:hypothetical protein